MSIEWSELQQTALRAKHDKDFIKHNLPLQYVLAQAGVVLEGSADDRLVALCPFHDDRSPSFDVYRGEDEDFDRCGCWSCRVPWHADVLDFIQTWKGCDFRESLEIANELYAEFKESKWEPVRVEPSQKVDPAEYFPRVNNSQATVRKHKNTILDFLHYKGEKDVIFQQMDPDWLIDEFRLGVEADLIIIPNYSQEMVFTGFKHRTTHRPPHTIGGIKHSELYGAWRIRGYKRVIICEGESDTWATAWTMRDEPVDVVGLPSGAAQNVPDEWKKVFKDKHVTILFDGDPAGRTAARKWWTSLTGTAELIWIASVDDDGDASSAANLRNIIDRALDVPATVPGFTVDGYKFVRPNNNEEKEATTLSDFIFVPERFLEARDRQGAAYEGTVYPAKKPAVIRNTDWESKRAMVRWANQLGYSWFGSDTDAQKLGNHLRREAPFLPRATLTEIAGWQKETASFVFPKPDAPNESYTLPVRPRWAYVAPPEDPRLHERILLRPGGGVSAVGLAAMLSIHKPEIVHPIAAWLAAAPFRSQIEQFPILFVTGGAGYGKTITVKALLNTFGWADAPTMSSSTRHAITSLVHSTNASPVWIDEYRRGARDDTKQALDQLLRDAWDGKATMRGGMNPNNFMQLTERKALAPIMVSGEEAFQETSHLERSAVINMSKDGKNPEALNKLRSVDMTGFGWVYLAWLADTYRQRQEDLPVPAIPTVTEDGQVVVADRPEWVKACLRWGWELLSLFSFEVLQFDIGDIDLSMVEKTIEEARESNPILDALAYTIGKPNKDDRIEIVWFDGDDVMVRVSEFSNFLQKDGQFILPGGRKAVAEWLRSNFGLPSGHPAEKFKFDALGVVRSALRLPNARADVEKRMEQI